MGSTWELTASAVCSKGHQSFFILVLNGSGISTDRYQIATCWCCAFIVDDVFPLMCIFWIFLPPLPFFVVKVGVLPCGSSPFVFWKYPFCLFLFHSSWFVAACYPSNRMCPLVVMAWWTVCLFAFLPGSRHAATIRLRPSVVCTSSFSCLFMRCFPVRVFSGISRDVYNILWCHMFVLLFLCVSCCFFCVFPEKSCRFIWFVLGKALLLHSLRW